MKLKFLFPISPYMEFAHFAPFGIGIIATMAKQAGFDVQVLLADADEHPLTYHKRVIQKIRDESIDVIAISGMSGHYLLIEQLIYMVKKENVIVILGGAIVDATPELVTANIGADFYVYGDGEYTFLELAEALETNKDVSDIRGLLYMQDGKFVMNPSREVVKDLDMLPFVDGDLLHYDVSLEYGSTLPLLLSRSCPFRCTFCFHPKGVYYRAKSLEYVFRELDYYIEKYGDKIKSLYIMDNLFADNKNRLLKFSKRIKEYKLPFRVQTRFDAIDEEAIIALKSAGAHTLAYGLESASNKVLTSMRKNTTIEKAKEILALTEKHGLKVQANLIIGDIEDDINTVRESEEFFHEYSLKYDLNIMLIQVLPGTHLYRHALEHGIIKDELTYMRNACPYINVSKLPDEVYAILQDKYVGFGASKNMITRRPLEKGYLEIDIHLNGHVTYTCYCPACSTKVIIENLDWRNDQRVPSWGCPVCNQSLNWKLSKFFSIMPASHLSIRSLAETFFRPYVGRRIAIWGIDNMAIRRLILESQILRNALIKIVDSKYESLTHETYCGLSVEKPETLKDVQFDYLIITAIVRRKEIMESLHDMQLDPPLIEIGDVFQN